MTGITLKRVGIAAIACLLVAVVAYFAGIPVNPWAPLLAGAVAFFFFGKN